MSLYAVTREAGPAWTEGKGAFNQPGVDEHAAYMSKLHDDGLVRFAGPLAGTEQARIRVLLIAEAADPSTLELALAQDPWERTQQIVTTSIELWSLLVGAST